MANLIPLAISPLLVNGQKRFGDMIVVPGKHHQYSNDAWWHQHDPLRGSCMRMNPCRVPVLSAFLSAPLQPTTTARQLRESLSHTLANK